MPQPAWYQLLHTLSPPPYTIRNNVKKIITIEVQHYIRKTFMEIQTKYNVYFLLYHHWTFFEQCTRHLFAMDCNLRGCMVCTQLLNVLYRALHNRIPRGPHTPQHKVWCVLKYSVYTVRVLSVQYCLLTDEYKSSSCNRYSFSSA